MNRPNRYDTEARRRIAAHPMPSRPVRLIYLVIAYLAAALGVTGVFVPVMPGVPFLLIAIWAAPKGSPRVHDWIYAQPKLARLLDEWYEQRAVPLSAKWLATAIMVASMAWIAWSNAHWIFLCSSGIFFTGVLVFLWSRPAPDG